MLSTPNDMLPPYFSLPTSAGTRGAFSFGITPGFTVIPHCLLGTGDVRKDRCALLSEYIIPIALQIVWIFLSSWGMLFYSYKVLMTLTFLLLTQ